MHLRVTKCQPKGSQRTNEFATNYSKLLSFHSSRKWRESTRIRPWCLYASLVIEGLKLFFSLSSSPCISASCTLSNLSEPIDLFQAFLLPTWLFFPFSSTPSCVSSTLISTFLTLSILLFSAICHNTLISHHMVTVWNSSGWLQFPMKLSDTTMLQHILFSFQPWNMSIIPLKPYVILLLPSHDRQSVKTLQLYTYFSF